MNLLDMSSVPVCAMVDALEYQHAALPLRCEQSLNFIAQSCRRHSCYIDKHLDTLDYGGVLNPISALRATVDSL